MARALLGLARIRGNTHCRLHLARCRALHIWIGAPLVVLLAIASPAIASPFHRPATAGRVRRPNAYRRAQLGRAIRRGLGARARLRRSSTRADRGVSHDSPLYKVLVKYSRDGHELSVAEMTTLFRDVGTPRGYSFASAVATGIGQGYLRTRRVSRAHLRHPERLLSVSIADLHKTIIKGQLGFRADGTTDWDEVDDFVTDAVRLSRAGGRITLEGIRQRVAKDVRRSTEANGGRLQGARRKLRLVEKAVRPHADRSYAGWINFMEVAGHREHGRPLYLTEEEVRAFFEKHLGMILEVRRERAENPSFLRAIAEMARAIVRF